MTSSDDLIASARSSVSAPSRIPQRRLAVVTCMDARIDVYRALRAKPGEIHVIRNAGGIVTDDAIRSLVVSQRYLETNQVMVMMHTDCGMSGFDDRAAANLIAQETGSPPPFSFGGFADLEQELRRGVELLRSTEALPHRDRITATIFDVTRQAVRNVNV